MPNISVDWNIFNYKFSGNTREFFEKLAYTLFCFEFNQKYGIFRYFNQPYIETQPIEAGDDIIGFQAKYYDASTQLADKEEELKKAIKNAKTKYTKINRFIIYTNKELSASSKKNQVKPQYQINIEKCGNDNGIKVEWRVPSNFEIMLNNSKLSAVKEFYFNPDSELQRFAEKIQKRTDSIFKSIKSTIIFENKIIKINYSNTEILDFIQSNKNAFVIYGNAGTGKSGYIKDFCELIYKRPDSSLLMLSATDFDVQEEIDLLNQFGKYSLENLLSLYDSEENKYCIIESAEKYSNFYNYNIFRSVIHTLIDSGWKIIFTIRKQYKEGFINAILDGVTIEEFYIDRINEDKLKDISEKNGFELPLNNNLRNLLCNLFYLKLYLRLLSSNTAVPADTKIFTEEIWKQVICNEPIRRSNLPVKRETFIENMAYFLLNNETYIYETQASDDANVISLLEEQGIITPYNDTFGLWIFSHDVYEEIIVNHIFDDKYNKTLDITQLTTIFNESLRSRKMYRIWLESKLREDDSNLLSPLMNALKSSKLSQSWQDETLIALMNSDNDKAFYIMESLFSANGFDLFTRVVFLLNTACKCVRRNKEYIQLIKTHKISAYRFTEPTGKYWISIFNYIYINRTLIPWNVQNLNVVIEAMETWTMNNSTGKTTSLIGRIALFLKNKIWQESNRQYVLYDDAIYKAINNIVLLSAIEIKDELSNMADNIICNKAFSHRGKDYIFLIKSLSNIYEGRNVYEAIPKKILQLAWEYWLYKNTTDHFSSGMESDFGLNSHLQYEYYPASAYQTPMWALLQIEPRQSIDYIIKITNHAATSYRQSRLNENDRECYEIQIILNDKESITQICSDRLWKIYRGTSVAPHLLESLLMALEKYLLLYVEIFTKEKAVALCFYLLKNSNNVAITAVVFSAVIAFPDKLFDVSCVLLCTKELFNLDKSRFLSERETNYIRGINLKYKRFDDERINSNRKDFRKKKFEEIILNYQVNSGNLSENDFKERCNKLYLAIDNATLEIEKWQPIYQAYYYNIDLRKYKQAGVPIIEEKKIILPMKADMPQQVIEYAEKSNTIFNKELRNTELMLWASYRYENNEKYKNYHKYEDNPLLAYETVKALLGTDEQKLPLLSIDTITFTVTVLLRDYNNVLDKKELTFCKEVLIELGFNLINHQLNLNERVKGAIIAGIAYLSVSSNNSIDLDTPVIILLSFMLDYRKHLRNNMIKMIKPLSVLWEKNNDLANKLIFLFSKLISLYDGKDVGSFVETHKEEIFVLLSADNYSLESIDVNVFDYNTRLYLNTLFDSHNTNILKFVIKIGKLCWEKLFTNNYDDSIDKIYQLEYEYRQWLAEYLLTLSSDEQDALIQELMPSVRFDENFRKLLFEIINAEDKNPRYDAFWNLWLTMREYIFQVCEKNVDSYKNTGSAMPIGYEFENVLVTYLLANLCETPDIDNWHSLKPQNRTFYMAVTNRLGYNPTILFSIAQLLYTIGKKPFKDEGINWFSDIIKNNPHLYKKPLPENTLFFIEEYIFSYAKEHIDSIQANIPLKRKIIIILDFLVSKGSTVGFLLKEEII